MRLQQSRQRAAPRLATRIGLAAQVVPRAFDEISDLVLPAKFRDGFADGLVLTKGQDRSIVVWPAAEFAAHAERLSEASSSDARARAYLRVLFSGASDEVMADPSGAGGRGRRAVHPGPVWPRRPPL